MSRYALNEVCIPGTSRHRREWGFAAPKNQGQIAGLCAPKVSKAWVSQFENARFRLDRSGAMRAAPAYFPEEHKRDARHAIRRTWMLWFANAEAYGDDSIKRYAAAIREIVLAEIPGLLHTPLLDPQQNPVIVENVAVVPDALIGVARQVPPEMREA